MIVGGERQHAIIATDRGATAWRPPNFRAVTRSSVTLAVGTLEEEPAVPPPGLASRDVNGTSASERLARSAPVVGRSGFSSASSFASGLASSVMQRRTKIESAARRQSVTVPMAVGRSSDRRQVPWSPAVRDVFHPPGLALGRRGRLLLRGPRSPRDDVAHQPVGSRADPLRVVSTASACRTARPHPNT